MSKCFGDFEELFVDGSSDRKEYDIDDDSFLRQV